MQKIYAIVLIALEINMTIKQLEKEIKNNLSQLNKDELLEIIRRIQSMIHKHYIGE